MARSSAECQVGSKSHTIDPSDRKKAEGGRGGMVRCKDCGKRLRLKPSGDSIKGKVES